MSLHRAVLWVLLTLSRVTRFSQYWTIVLCAIAITLGACAAFAQDESAQALAERSAIIVRGKVLKIEASNEPLLAASPRTAIISVLQMYAGAEIAGDQKGRNMTVILFHPGQVKIGEEALFFGNPRFAGRSLTIADEGEIPSTPAFSSAVSVLQMGVQARKEKPIADRLASASLVFRGSVESVHPIEGSAGERERAPAQRNEHDPEWQAATVRIATALRGGTAGEIVTVIFAGSRDIVWFHSPKLKPGEDAVFLAQPLNKENATLYRTSGLSGFLDKQTAYVVADAADVLPATSEARIRDLLARAKETK